MTEETDGKGKYPQINANTGISLSLLVILVGGIWYFSGIAYRAESHSTRITAVETAIERMAAANEAGRAREATENTKLEVRLVRIEIMLQDVITRLTRSPP